MEVLKHFSALLQLHQQSPHVYGAVPCQSVESVSAEAAAAVSCKCKGLVCSGPPAAGDVLACTCRGRGWVRHHVHPSRDVPKVQSKFGHVGG